LDTTKVAILIASTGSMRDETVASLMDIVFTSNGITADTFIAAGSVIIDNRNKLVEGVINKGYYSHILFIDTDMELEHGVLLKMLSHKKPIVGATFNVKQTPTHSIVKLIGKNGEIVGGELPKELFECYALGCGCMLIETDVFRTTPFPWFMFDYDEQRGLITEDVYFCKKARAAGFRTWCDPTIKAGHIGAYKY
jgi:hypothetical protein